MKLFKVFNGYYGSASISVLAIAEDRAEALKLARPIFRNSSDYKGCFPDSMELQTEVIFEHCDISQCSNLMVYR
jgi:hypothetical protein